MHAALLAVVAAVGLRAAAPAWFDDPAAARAAALETGRPLLIEFHAPWCYSCYYMEGHVLSRPGFARFAERLVLLKADVDRAEGRALKSRHRVRALPTFLVLDARGRELGRIAGEQTETEFLERLGAFLGDQPAAGPNDAAVLRRRIESGGRAEAVAALKTLLEREDSCALFADVLAAEKLVEAQGVGPRAELLAAERAALEPLAERRLFVPAGGRCADFRSGVRALADVYGRLGERRRREELLRRALGFLEAMGLAPGEDRNHDDDVRYFLEQSGEEARLRSFYETLAAAYPADYVYPYRYARRLLDAGEAAAALEWSEKADKLAYGANRLAVTKVRARALAGLGRQAEAAALLRRDIKAGKAFPEEARSLEELLAGLGRR